MCEWGNDEEVLVYIRAEDSYTGKARMDMKGIDKCIAPIVKALTQGGVLTVGSCCGHGKYKGGIELADGRILRIEEGPEGGTGCVRAKKENGL